MMLMPTYNLGTLTIVKHDVQKLTDAIGIPEHRFDDLVEFARKAYDFGETISQSIEYVAQRLTGAELVLAMVLFGRVWESKKREEDEKKKAAAPSR